MAELPTGTVTFLFTDLEGSTRLWQEHPDAMKGALARHDEILRAAGTIEDDIDPVTASSVLLNDVVVPAVSQAEKAFSLALSRINLEDLVRQAEPLENVS